MSVCVGCGLTVTEDGVLVLDGGEAEWPYPCSVGTGNGLRCDPVTGHAWAPPDIGVVCGQSVTGSVSVLTSTVATGTSGQTPAPFAEIVNPSDCLDLVVDLEFWMRGSVYNSSPTNWFSMAYTLLGDNGSGSATSRSVEFATVGIWSDVSGGTPSPPMIQSIADVQKECITIPPGESVQVRAQAQYVCQQGADLAGYDAYSQVRWFGVNTHV